MCIANQNQTRRLPWLCLVALAPTLVAQSIGLTPASAQEIMSPGPYRAPIRYVLRLPKYCHGQYFDMSGPQYRISRELCGVGTNHFCPGLINLEQARESTDANKKARYYRKAQNHMEYTLRHIADDPGCPLLPTVNRLHEEIGLMLKIYQ